MFLSSLLHLCEDANCYLFIIVLEILKHLAFGRFLQHYLTFTRYKFGFNYLIKNYIMSLFGTKKVKFKGTNMIQWGLSITHQSGSAVSSVLELTWLRVCSYMLIVPYHGMVNM